jgi:general nucleoside transport system permease protein
MGELAFWTAVLASAVRLTVPTLLAATGELVSQRAGVLNLGLEGMMIAGAFSSFAVVVGTGSEFLGLLAGMAGGLLIGVIMVVISVRRGGNQIVTGLALTLFGLGAAAFLNDQLRDVLHPVPTLPALGIPLLEDIPLIGRALFDQNALAYLTAAIVLAITGLLRFTRFGLETAATGHAPISAEAKGVAIHNVRSVAALIAAAAAGLGGAAISVGAVGNFGPNMTAGRGFVAIAVVLLGRWRPGWMVLGAFVFGFTDALQLRLQNLLDIPVQILAALPWVAVLLLLAIGSRVSQMPAALGRDLAEMA